MIEGWSGDDYFIVFESEDESDQFTTAYDLANYLPGYRLAGLKSWDDFIVISPAGDGFVCPTVPMIQKYFEPFDLNRLANTCSTDPRLAGKIKWYTKPIVFGGDPKADANIDWVSINKHAELVRFWNDTYRQMTSAT